VTEVAESTPPDATRWCARRLRNLALGSAVLFVLVYLLAVHTQLGQEWDDRAVLERFAAGKKQVNRAQDVLDAIRVQSLVVVLLVLIAIGFWRRRPWAAASAVMLFAGTILLAELLKLGLPRPDLSQLEERPVFDGINTFPSGHATIATSLVLALLLVASARWRPWIAIVGLVFAATVTWGTLAAGWHRPSDAIGGILLATACFAAGASWLLPRYWQSATGTGLANNLFPIGGLLLALLALAARIVTWWAPPGDNRQLDSATYITASVLILVTVAISILGFARLLKDQDWSPRTSDEPTVTS
jgi:membrane-associated phospholipid phosphatase